MIKDLLPGRLFLFAAVERHMLLVEGDRVALASAVARYIFLPFERLCLLREGRNVELGWLLWLLAGLVPKPRRFSRHH